MMPGYWRAATILLLAAPMPLTAASAQAGFNGVITFLSDRSAGKQDTFVQYTKGNKVRIDGFGSSHGAMIVDNDAKVIMMVDPEKQQYMTMTEDDAKQMQAMMGPMMEKMKQRAAEKADAGKLTFGKTGKTETVAGVPCEVYRGAYTDEDGEKDEGEACIATGVGFALDALTFNNPMMQASSGAMRSRFEQYRQIVGPNRGILKATSFKGGKASTQMEAIKIERKSLGNDVFAPPAGYKEIRMGDMMMQAQNQMKQMRDKANQGNPQHGEPDTKQGQGVPNQGQDQDK
jgi:hypothetical protein